MSDFSRVVSADGTRLAVYQDGHPSNPTVVAIHGFPDNHTVWDGVAELLAGRYHVVRYDVRGAGESDKPAGRRAYRMDRLSEDLAAVIDATSPDAPVHLLAHDWGSIQTWGSVTAPHMQRRLASFISISGPSIDHAGIWIRRIHQHPVAVLRQLIESYYILLFQLPRVPEALLSSRAGERLLDRAAAIGSVSAPSMDPVVRSTADRLNGINLYRANFPQRLLRPRPGRTDLPVLVLTPERDIFATPAVQTQAPAPYVPNLQTRSVAGGHWVVSDQPQLIAGFAMEFFASVQRDIAAPHADAAPRRSAR
jgi:pimeloyl-ACP methyl ester carboxylesterase